MESKDAFGRTKKEQDALGAALLIRAFHLLCSEGWLHPRARAPWSVPGEEGLSIRDAVWASHNPKVGPMETVYALRLVEKIEPLHHNWEAHYRRTALDVLRMLQAAVALGGEEPPRVPRGFGKKQRGGWRVSHGRTVH